MTLYEFNALKDDAQAEATWSGKYLTDRTEGDFIIQLYSLGEFYVEVYCDSATNSITRLRSFKSNRILALYF